MHCVPHGSVLGPTLFNIHINRITSSCAGNDCSFTFYADDTEIYVSNASIDTAEGLMISRLRDVHLWLQENGLINNKKKTETMAIRNKRR